MRTILLAIMLAAVVLASWLYNGELTVWNAILAALPVLFLIQGISISQNMRRAWGRATPDMARAKTGMSAKISVWSYIASTSILPFIWIAISAMAGMLPLTTIIVFLTLPVAIGCSRTMYKLMDGATGLLADLSARTATLTILFSLLLSLALVIGRFI